MTDHVREECIDPCCNGCFVCNLYICAVCGGAEGSLTADGCPGFRMTAEEDRAVFEDGATARELCARRGVEFACASTEAEAPCDLRGTIPHETELTSGAEKMPLPTKTAAKTAPTANPNSAKQPPAAASKGKSRLPAMPKGGLKAPKAYQYIDIPKDQDRGFYLLKLNSCEQILSTKDNCEKVKMEFTVLDTDVRGVRAGSVVSGLHSLQGDASLYFWKEVSPIWIALAGGEVSDASLEAFTESAEATFSEVVAIDGEGGGGLNDQIVRVNLRRVEIKKDKDGNALATSKWRVYRDWEPANDEEIAKYGDAQASE